MNLRHILVGGVCLLALGSAVKTLGFQPPGRAAATQSHERDTPPARGERYADTLKPEDLAPDFELPDAAGAKTVRLSSFRGKKPVVLIFGSYT